MPAKLEALATEYIENSRPIGLVIESEQVVHQAIDALRFYAAYGPVQSISSAPGNVPGLEALTRETQLTNGEWGMVRPLFILYVERENALHLEASESLGVTVYGRRSAEVTQDITIAEELCRFGAFSRPIIAV